METPNKKYLILALLISTLVLILVIQKDWWFGFFSKKTTKESSVYKFLIGDNFPKIIHDFAIIWITDFNHNRVIGFDPQGKVVWQQNMSSAPIPQSSWYYIGGVENITIAPNGNLITVHGDGMMVQEIDRKTHALVWQYGTAGIQTYRGGALDEPDKSYKINDHEVVINDGNDREVKVVDQRTNQAVWQYGQYHVMNSAPGFLRGNTSVQPIGKGKQFLITDTLEKKIILIDRATKNIVWQWSKPDSQWLQNVFVTRSGTFILEDRIKGEVFEINRDGKVIWLLDKLSDGKNLINPTDSAKLENGDVLIAEAGRNRIVEVVPETGKIVRQYLIHGLASSMAIDYHNLNGSSSIQIDKATSEPKTGLEEPRTYVVNDDSVSSNASPGAQTGRGQQFSGKVVDVNASTSRAGSFSMTNGNISYGVQVYNYSKIVDNNGTVMNLAAMQKNDKVSVSGTISGTYIRATFVQDNSR